MGAARPRVHTVVSLSGALANPATASIFVSFSRISFLASLFSAHLFSHVVSFSDLVVAGQVHQLGVRQRVALQDERGDGGGGEQVGRQGGHLVVAQVQASQVRELHKRRRQGRERVVAHGEVGEGRQVAERVREGGEGVVRCVHGVQLGVGRGQVGERRQLVVREDEPPQVRERQQQAGRQRLEGVAADIERLQGAQAAERCRQRRQPVVREVQVPQRRQRRDLVWPVWVRDEGKEGRAGGV